MLVISYMTRINDDEKCLFHVLIFFRSRVICYAKQNLFCTIPKNNAELCCGGIIIYFQLWDNPLY